MKNTPDFTLLVLTLLLVGFGIIMVYSASSSLAIVSAKYDHDAFYFGKRQLKWAILGTVAMLVVMNVPYTIYKRLFMPLFIVTITMLILVLYIGKNLNGARSWFGIGSIGIQPTELAKISIVLYLATLITKKGEDLRAFKKGLFPIVIIIGFVVGLIMLQPDLGSAVILVACTTVIVIVGGANLKHLLLGLISIVILFSLYILIFSEKLINSYQFKRIQSWLNPFHDSQEASYQMLHSLKAIAHGGWTGAGFGQSIQKLFYLPYAYNDFIFAIIAEEWGLIGTSIFLLIYLLFIWRGILIALHCPDTYGMLVCAGIVSIIALPALINIGGVTGTIPVTGTTLPLISHGGSSLFVTMISIGILLNISRGYNHLDLCKDPSDNLPGSLHGPYKRNYRILRFGPISSSSRHSKRTSSIIK